MDIRHLLSFWRTIQLPGLLSVMRDWRSFLRMHFLYAALDVGLLEVLNEPADKETLRVKLDIKRPELLSALLDMGVALKELSLSNAVYGLKGRRAKALVGRKGDALAALIQANVTYYHDAYRQMGKRLRGAPLGQDLKDIGETVARFAKIGEPLLSGFIKSLVAGKGSLRLLDVGCGSGFVFRSVSGANVKAYGIGLDLDDKVAEQARANLIRWELQERFSIVCGDILAAPEMLSGRFDLITAFNLIYYFTEDKRLDLFSRCRDLLSGGGRLALVNTFDSKQRDVAAANLNIVNCSLEGLTVLPELAALQDQLKQCGFNRVKVVRFMPRNEFFGMTAQV